MFFFSNPISLHGYEPLIVTDPIQINLTRGENTSLFFVHRDSFGFGIDLSGCNSSFVIKRYPNNAKILFFMDEYKVLYNPNYDDFIYSPTADSIGFGGSSVNIDYEENSFTGGIVFPLYGEDTSNLPKGNYYYEVSITKNNHIKDVLYEGRIYIDDPPSPSTTGPKEPQIKDIEITKGMDTHLFFKHIDSFGNGIDVSSKKTKFTLKRYPIGNRFLMTVENDKIVLGENPLEFTGSTYSSVNQDEEGNSLTGGMVFFIPSEATETLPQGIWHYAVQITGNGESLTTHEGRAEVLANYYSININNIGIVQ